MLFRRLNKFFRSRSLTEDDDGRGGLDGAVLDRPGMDGRPASVLLDGRGVTCAFGSPA